MSTNPPKILTQARLKELLHYEPETGIFTHLTERRHSPYGKNPAGQIVVVNHSAGYKAVRCDGKQYLAHRLAFLYMTGVVPENEVDHINGVRSDDRWTNLREVLHQENMHNTGGNHKHNTSGFTGASWDNSRQNWRAFITLNNRYVHLGNHATPELAHAAYLKAKDELHPTHRRLRVAA